MTGTQYSWTDLFYYWVIDRPLIYHIIFLGVAIALLYFSIKREDPAYFGWYAGWVIGIEGWSAICAVAMMLDTATHLQARDFAFDIIYTFAGQWIRTSLLLWIGNIIVLRTSLLGQILGPLFAIVLSVSVGVFSVSVILDLLVFEGG